VISFLIKPHSWDLQSKRLGINHNVIIWISVLSPSMFHSPAFLLVARSKGSAKLIFDLTKSMDVTPVLISYLTIL
jgi:hypothetical protein